MGGVSKPNTAKYKFSDNYIVVTLCNQVLDALLRLLSISEFVETLQGLLDRADNEVSPTLPLYLCKKLTKFRSTGKF